MGWLPDSKWKVPVIAASYSLAALTGILRVASGEHFASDVLVGALFAATENHQIKITVTIAAEVPAFQLMYSTANSNSSGVKYGTAPATKADATPVAVDIDFESNADGDRKVTVDARIANAAKQNKVYTLTFSDGVFKDNEDKTLNDAIKCWNYKKSLKGHNKYEKSDLDILN